MSTAFRNASEIKLAVALLTDSMTAFARLIVFHQEVALAGRIFNRLYRLFAKVSSSLGGIVAILGF